MKLNLPKNGVIPTGNDVIALPVIRSHDAALENFNVLSIKHRGLLEAAGTKTEALLSPFVQLNGKAITMGGFTWELLGSWIPVGTLKGKGLEIKVTYDAPMGARGALIRIQARNISKSAAKLTLGLKVCWSGLNRVIYASSPLGGTRQANKAPWVGDAVVFSQHTDDMVFAWCLQCRGGKWKAKAVKSGPLRAEISKAIQAKAGEEAEASFFLGVGVEEFSASNSAKTIGDRAELGGASALIDEHVRWCQEREKTTGDAHYDQLMNRNFLFNRFYAWGRSLDTEQLVGVTSRSPRYYVCAAYWDRDSMIWSFPALLDIDPAFAKEALTHALTTQLRNTGCHSRFIDGTVLEAGFQLDEACGPILAVRDYLNTTNDLAFIKKHSDAIDELERILLGRRDATSGLFNTHEDSQDEYIPEPYFTYANAMSYQALGALADLRTALGQKGDASTLLAHASKLKAALPRLCSAKGAPGAKDSILARTTNLKDHRFEDVPPGSLLKLPLTGVMREDDPLFNRTYDWLHSPDHRFSNHDKPYGLPGSWRVSFTTPWAVADHLRLKRGKEQAVKILRKATWDYGIVSEGLDPKTGEGIGGGSAFAAAAGYVAHAIWDVFGKK